MLRAAVSLDAQSKDCVKERRVKVGENFDVIVTIWDDGEGGSPVIFDTFISEVWYNDKGIIVQMDLNKPPTAAALADNSHTTVDAFSLDRVFETDSRLPKDSLEFGTPLTRLDSTIHPAGLRNSASDLWKVGTVLQPGYKEATGRAGLSDFQNPFKISPDRGVISAVKGRASARKDARAVQEGETNLIAVCQAFLGSQPVPVISEVSTLRVYGE
jgi:hypothetical protein